MMTNSLPLIPTDDQIAQAAEKFGEMILSKTAPVERRYIREYGNTLLADATPTYNLTARFHIELADLSPRLPGYGVQLARMSTQVELISDLQSRIAFYVARTDAEQGAS